MIFFEIGSHSDLKQAFRSIFTIFVLLHTIQLPAALGGPDSPFVHGSHLQKLSHSSFVKIRRNSDENQYRQNLLVRAQSSVSASTASTVSASSTSATSGSTTASTNSASSLSSTNSDSQSASSVTTTSSAQTTTSSTSTTTTDTTTSKSTSTTSQSTTVQTKSIASASQSSTLTSTSTISLNPVATQAVSPSTSVSSPSASPSSSHASSASSSFLSKVFNHGNKFFPVAIAVSVLIGISFILFVLGVIQCIIRRRFLKKEVQKNQAEMNEKLNQIEDSEEPTKANASETLFNRAPPTIEPTLRPTPSFRSPYQAARGRADREMMDPRFPPSQRSIEGNRVGEAQEYNRFRNGPEYNHPYSSMPQRMPQATLNTYPDPAARNIPRSTPGFPSYQNSDFVPNGLSSFEPRRISRPLPGQNFQTSNVPSKYPYGQFPLPSFAPGGNDPRYGGATSITLDASPRGSREDNYQDRRSYSSGEFLMRTSDGNFRAQERSRGESRNSTLRYGY